MHTSVPLRPRNAQDLLQMVKKIGDRADWIEIWLDQFTGDIPKIESHKLIGCCKTPAERGNFLGTAKEKIEVLQRFLKAGGNLVDLDIRKNEEDLIRQIPGDKLLLSYHNFDKMSNNLDDILVQMYFLSPAICKFSVTVNDPMSLELFLSFVKNFPADQNAIFTTMGGLGRDGRESIEAIGKSWGRFVALNEENRTDPSQEFLSEL